MARQALWADIFPWLITEGGTVSSLARKPTSGAGASRDVHQLSSHVLERRPRDLLHNVFPAAPAQLPTLFLSLNASTAKLLEEQNVRDLEDLWRMRVGDFADVWDDLFRALVDQSATRLKSSGSLVNRSGEQDPPDGAESLLDNFRLLAAWQTLLGNEKFPLLQPAPGEPDWVIAARRRIEGFTAEELQGPQSPAEPVELLLEELLSEHLVEREETILRDRILTSTPATLEELGRTFGVTRERVRQIESKLQKSLLNILQNDRVAAFRAQVLQATGTVASLETLVGISPALARTIPGWEIPVWQFLAGADPNFDSDGTWCAAPTLQEAAEVTRNTLSTAANLHGVVNTGQLVDTPLGFMGENALAEWIKHLGYVVKNPYVFIKTKSVNDYAAAALSVAGVPMSPSAILTWFGLDRSERGLRNALSQDDRFDRVDKSEWGLTEWEMDSYVSIKELIEEEVTSGGGTAPLTALAESITGRFSVSASSVQQYATSWPFEVRDGMVQFAENTPQVRVDPQVTARFYRRGDAWLHRITISAEHLRGSGTGAPMALATIVGLTPGGSVSLPSRLGNQKFYWAGAQPGYGTIRRFLEDVGLSVGQQAFLVFHASGTFSLESVEQTPGDPLSAALALIGAPTELSQDVALLVMPKTIGLESAVTWSEIIQGFADRGDEDIVELLKLLID